MDRLLILALIGAAPLLAQAPTTASFLTTLNRAESATRGGDWAEAAARWAQIVEGNPLDGRFWNELGNARANSGDQRQAITAYERVIALGWGAPANTAYRIATIHAQQNDKELALMWLDKAFQMGYRGVDVARRDPNFRLLRDDVRFRRIVLLPDPGTMSRDDGWRFDLDALAREVKRVGYAPLLHGTSTTFDAGVARLRTAIPRLTDVQVILEMMKLMRTLGDGHATIQPGGRSEFQLTLPMQFYAFAEGLYIIAADPKYRELLGAQVLRFDAQPADSVMRALEPFISRDNDNPIWVQQRVPYLMRHVPVLQALGLTASSREVTLALRLLDGSSRSVKVSADSGSNSNIWNVLPHPATWIGLAETLPDPMPLYLKSMGTPFWFEQPAGSKLVYSQINSVRNMPNETLPQFGERVSKFIAENDVDGLVVDLRWNNGGNTFLAEGFLQQMMRADKINRRGRLFVVIGRRTYSAAQNLATFLERHTNAIFVGEPTGSSPNFVGEEEFFTLPYSGLAANVSELFWQSSWPGDHRTWIAPLLYTPPTFAAYRRNHDPAMEAIAEYRRGGRN